MIQESRVKDQPRTVMPRPTAQREHAAFADYHPVGLARITWGSVIAGAVAAIGAQVLFATLGLAIGLSVPGTAEGIGIFAGIWWLVTGLISLFIGGWVAGRFSGVANEMDTSIHGVMTWALATMLSILFVTGFGGVIAGGAVGAVASDLLPQQQQTATNTATFASVADENPMAFPPEQELAETAAGAAWWTFFALLLGVIAAGAGGFLATPREADNIGYSNSGSSGSSGTSATPSGSAD